MAGIKEIRTRIDSVQQTLKITNAMYLISSSKLRKARQQFNAVQPFFQKVTETISDILHYSPAMEHVYFDKRPHCIGTYRGLHCDHRGQRTGRGVQPQCAAPDEERPCQTLRPMLFLIGQVGRSYFSERGVPVDGEFMYTAQDPTFSRAEEISDTFIQLFRQGKLDEVYVVYTDMVTPMRLEPKVQKLLPLDMDAFSWTPRPEEEAGYRQMVTYVPNEHQVLSHIVPGYVTGYCLVHWWIPFVQSRMPA